MIFIDMNLDKVRNLIQLFNDGEYEDEIEPYFNNLLNFFNYVKKYGLLDEIDLDMIPDSEYTEEVISYIFDNNLLPSSSYNNIPDEFKNLYLLRGLEDDYESTVVFITNELLTDVNIRPDGFYLRLTDREELVRFFCKNTRNSSSRDVALKVLSGDDYDTYTSYYRKKPSEVLDDLDESNITRLKDIVYKKIGNVEFSLNDYHSDFFDFLSEEQGIPGYFRIRAEDLNDLFKDSESFDEIMEGEMEELSDELSNLYNNAENSAFADELYSLVYNSLEEYFSGKIDEVPREVTRTDGSKITRYDSYIKIKDFIGLVKQFLNENKIIHYNDSNLEYFGNFTDFMVHMMKEELIECLSIYYPEYPDWSLTQKNLNSMFNDYI